MTQSCPNCGAENQDEYKFCSSCGTPLKAETSTPEQAAPLAPTSENQTAGVFTVPQAGSSPAPYGQPPSAEAYRGYGSSAPASYVVKRSEPEYPQYDPTAPTMPMSAYPAASPYETPAQSVPPPPPPSQYTGYQSSDAGASGGREGAAYAPYTPASVTALEKPKDQRSWLMPMIAVAAVVLLVLVGVSGYLVLNNRNGLPSATGNQPAASTTPSSASDLPANASEEDKIRAVIRQSNENQIRAWKELDEEILQQNYTGQALQENLDMVRQLKDNSLYAVPVNERLDIVNVKINGDTATANTVEEWTVTFYRKADKKKFETRGPDTLEETYYLVKVDGVWKIERLTIDQQQLSTPGT